MATQTELKLVISAQNKANAELNKLSNDLKNVEGKANSSGLSLGKMIGWLGGAAVAYGVVKKGIIDSIAAWEEQEKAVALLNATLKSTEGVAGVTTKMATDLANSLQLVTKYADEDTIAMEGVLLTFTRINRDIFPETVGLVQDISTRLGQDLQSSAIQVGKALQDPILGMTALRRVGVNFTASDKKTVEQMLASGKVMEAQKFILHELQVEFGGAAKAAGDTFGGRLKILKNLANDLQEVLGKSLIETLYGLFNGFNLSSQGVVDFANNARKSIGTWVPAFIFGLKSVWQTLYALGQMLVDVNKMMFDLFTYQFGAAGKSAEDLSTHFNSIGEAWLKNADDSAAATDRINADFTEVGTGVPKQLGYVSEAAGEMAKKVEEARKKISDLKEEMKKAVQEAKDDIKKLKEDFKKQEVEAQQNLGKSIADIIVQKQTDLLAAQDEYKKATTDEEKKTADEKIKTIQDFLNSHLTEQQQYSAQILQAQQFAQMDEIQQLLFTFAEEKKARQADYEDQMKDLKKHLKDVEKEYKDKLKDLKKELQKELGNIVLTISVDKETKKKKAFGGAVSSGTPYIVGEYRPEVFVPSQSGNIRQVEQGKNITINFNNPIVREESDINAIIKKVEQVMNRKQEFYQIGAY